MRKMLKLVPLFLIAVSLVGFVNAGYMRDDVMYFMGMGSLGLLAAGLGALVLIGVIFLFAFWLWMLIDCLKRDFKSYDKIVWVLVMIYLQVLGSLIYYIIVKAQDKKSKVEDKKKGKK